MAKWNRYLNFSKPLRKRNRKARAAGFLKLPGKHQDRDEAPPDAVDARAPPRLAGGRPPRRARGRIPNRWAREPSSLSKFVGARSRQYRSRFLQANTPSAKFELFFVIYKIDRRSAHLLQMDFLGGFPGFFPVFVFLNLEFQNIYRLFFNSD